MKPADHSDETNGDGAEGFSQELVVRFVGGDREAFLQVFDRLKGTVLIQARRFFNRPFDQEEAFQEAWLQIYRRRARVDVNRHHELAGWVRQVARNRCLDLLKARGRGRELPVESMEAPCEASQHQALAGRRLRAALEEFVSRLDPEQQRHFALCFVRELSHEEVAAEMSITVRRSKYLKKKTVTSMVKSPALRKARDKGP